MNFPVTFGVKKGRDQQEKLCGVCGDRAIGFNFDAISCESCKAFFRRNAPKGTQFFKCPYDENCRMDLTNRRFCKHCRLKKCFDIGMKREYIMSDEEKLQKKKKIEENRQLRDMEKQVQVMKMDEVTSQTVALTSVEAADIQELMSAYHNSLQVNIDKHVSRDQASFLDLINIAELSIRRVIAMAKQITAFKSLTQSDQICLLKGGSIELLIIRSVITFDKDKQHFLDPVDQVETKAMNIEQLRHAEIGTGLFDEHMKFIRSIAIDLLAEETSLILLLMISLFSPDRPGLTEKDVVARQQERYSLLLRKFLMSRHPLVIARVIFPKLLMKLTDLRNLNEGHSQVLLNVDPDFIQPLMKEVLDLHND